MDTTLANLAGAVLDGVGETHFVLVEGAGGFYSPLALDGSNADLAERLQLPVLLVAPDRLGVINHVLLSLEAIARRDLRTFAVVLNRTEHAAALPAGMDNFADLRESGVPVFQTQPGESLGAEHALARALLAAVQGG